MNNKLTAHTVQQAKDGDTAAAEQIVQNMQRHVQQWATQIAGKHHQDDATLEGMAALWEAVLTYETTHGASFYTHARRVVRLAIFNSVANNNDGPTVHERTSRRYFALMRETDGDATKAAALAESASINLSVETFWAAHRALDNTERFDLDTSDTTAASVMDTASTSASDDVEKQALDNIVAEDMLAQLTNRQATILEYTYGLNGHRESKDNEIAAALGISRPRVVTIRGAALRSLAANNQTLKGMA